MFEATSMLFIYTESPLHAGTGRGLGAIDLPIQRERVTGYPIVRASSLKGRLRAEARDRIDDIKAEEGVTEGGKAFLTQDEHEAIFGPESNPEYAGALSTGDARLLLFPVRSLNGVFAWTTSKDVLDRFLRDAKMAGVKVDWQLPGDVDEESALVSGTELVAGGRIVLEEFSFSPVQETGVAAIGKWFAEHALPSDPVYDYWKSLLPNHLVVLHKDAFRDFTTFSTEVVTRVSLDPDTKTVIGGALWNEENLPVDSLLYATIMASPTRGGPKERLSGDEVLSKVKDVEPEHTVLGGNETIGRGMVALTFAEGGGA